MEKIRIRGTRTHNLKNFDIDIPRDKLIVITGLSGSGKSSLAFDTIYAEGQRRYVESLSAYARQFLSIMEKPDIDHIEGLSPAISIEQKSTSHNPRSTVGTITEIHDYLRLLFARAGIPYCPEHKLPLTAQTISQMTDKILDLPEGSKVMLLAPVVSDRKGKHHTFFNELNAQGFIRARIDGVVYELDDAPELNANKKHTVEVVIDRIKIRDGLQQRIAESLETALTLSDGMVRIAGLENDMQELVFSAKFACPECGYSIPELEPRLFSFNSPTGACPTCNGLGQEQYFDPEQIVVDPALSLAAGAIRSWDRRHSYYFSMIQSLGRHYGFNVETAWEQLPEPIKKVLLFGSGDQVIDFHYFNEKGGQHNRKHPFEGIIPNMERRYHETESNAVREELSRYISHHHCRSCNGSRLNTAACNVYIENASLPTLSHFPIKRLREFFNNLKLTGKRGEIAKKIIEEITRRLEFLLNVGLNYLSLERSAETLSGGEAQRIRLASQIGAGLVGVMYILDEPSIGLHQRDNTRLLQTLCHLRDIGNTVIVVEHDEEAIRAADQVIDIGPGAGVHGGEIVAQGTPDEIVEHPNSLTGKYLSGRLQIDPRRILSTPSFKKVLELLGACGNNLKSVDLQIPVGYLTCITGVSGSGKSTLINDTLYPLAANHLNHASHSVAPHASIKGLEYFDKVVDIDQSPIGRTPRSNPATYTGLFTTIRDLFAGTQEARARGYTPGRFSFNVKGGRCEACKGDGLIKVEMHFLPDIYVPCDICKGKRYNRETLDVRYKGKSINEVLGLTIEEALHFFDAVPPIKRKLQTLMDVGLSYITLGQSATTLSGGEAQRVKLARELSKRDTGNTLYILDEPTTGLHFHDIKHLLEVLHRLRDHGNTVIVIEHNLDVIKSADWIVDLGPEGGDEGGQIICEGTPQNVSKDKRSYTGAFLRPLLKSSL